MTHSVLSSLSLSSSSLLTPSQSPCPIGSGNCDRHSCVGSSHHQQAQRWNNKAAQCIEIGGRPHYQKAISILAKALRLSGEEQDQDAVVCTCHYCSIDGCIVSNDDDYNGTTTTEMNEDNSDGSTIDEKPIYVYEGHNMGSTLTYIIAFNLAIAHHLTAMEMANNDEEKNEKDVIKQEKIINTALQFYELAYECNLTNTCSMRFDMIICNNLSHIYRHQEQQQQTTAQQQHIVVAVEVEVEVEPQQERQTQAQSIIIDDDDDTDISFEYYSEKEEQEEYEHNSSLVSLLTTRSISSSSTSSTTPTSTNTDRQNGLSSHQYSSSSLSFLHFDHQKEAGNEFCVTSSTPERDSNSIRSMYTTCIV